MSVAKLGSTLGFNVQDIINLPDLCYRKVVGSEQVYYSTLCLKRINGRILNVVSKKVQVNPPNYVQRLPSILEKVF